MGKLQGGCDVNVSVSDWWSVVYFGMNGRFFKAEKYHIVQ
jgi:hypothetical protein